MKIIHCADIHLGSKLTSKFPEKASRTRRNELRSTFSKMIDFAKQNEVKVIILSGDVFDSDTPLVKDKDLFYDAVRSNPEIDFLYLKGNHDKDGSYSQGAIPNLKTFDNSGITSYTYENVVISGIELGRTNAVSFYSMIELDKDKLNILMLHGEVSDSMGECRVKLSELRNKGIDYLALGHIHSHKIAKLDDRGVWAYSGCLEGRGFDECGEKGFVLLDVQQGSITPQFQPFACRTIHKIEFDVSGCGSLYDISQQLKSRTSTLPNDDILRVELTGELSKDIDLSDEDIISELDSFFFVNVKNKTTVKINADDYTQDRSLIGEFVRGVYDNEDYDDEQKNKLAALGVKLLSGKAVEL